MNTYQVTLAYNKVYNTILSCTTKSQLIVAENLAELFLAKIGNPTKTRLYLKSIIQNHSINCI